MGGMGYIENRVEYVEDVKLSVYFRLTREIRLLGGAVSLMN